MKKWAIFVKIFVYLLNIVFVSLQPYMRETNYCLRKFNCLTKAKSLTLDLREARFTRHKTSYFHFLFFSQVLCGIRKLLTLYRIFFKIFLQKFHFLCSNLDLGIIACFWNSLFFLPLAEIYFVFQRLLK